MKKLHLICNSHIDPVWMWDWEEGLGEAISTFYQAEQFLREYDYIFNHNEALLYEFVEERPGVVQGNSGTGKSGEMAHYGRLVSAAGL